MAQQDQKPGTPDSMQLHRRRQRLALLGVTAVFVGVEFGLAAIEWLEGSRVTAIATAGIGVMGALFAAYLDHNVGRQMEVVRQRENELKTFADLITDRSRRLRGETD